MTDITSKYLITEVHFEVVTDGTRKYKFGAIHPRDHTLKNLYRHLNGLLWDHRITPLSTLSFL